MTLKWETRRGWFSGMKAVSPASAPYSPGNPRFYRIKIRDDNCAIAFAPILKDGMKIFEGIDEAKAWCEEHEQNLRASNEGTPNESTT